ncbi:DoxX family protein [Mesorhizobium captivum]|uniref:DoxX family protein n=1 Tax=Mesorhizobium captivum TaxID=3072319 RepID=UPI002A24A35A|nr:DoxX family protein [Mesorhizobium sp. VK23E]MDX8512725.1 DoxX family protein [Mesorhizobium sp. VK23E]
MTISTPELVRTLTRRLSSVAMAVAPVFLRTALAVPFFRSGLTRWDGFLQLSDSTVYLFEEEFKLHIFGAEYGFPMPDAVAYLVATAELVLPVLLVLGLATRFAALAMLVMTGVIQLVVPDGWANFHLPWAAMAISIIALGAGPISLDRLIALRFASEAHRQ